MASIYKRTKSPFWYIQYTENGKRRNHSTQFRWDCPHQTNQAQELRAKFEIKELRSGHQISEASWHHWVPAFFKRHCKTPRTLQAYTARWRWVQFWLNEKQIHTPRSITYRHSLEYLEWRKNYKKKTGSSVGHNTALLDLKTFSMVMQEAVRLGYAESNPLTRLGIPKEKPAEKAELSDEDIVEIREALKTEPEWMRLSFEISLHTGCRLRETVIPIELIDLKRKTITFPTPKGGYTRAFSIPIPDGLMKAMQGLKKSKRTVTLKMPFQPSRRWQQFFQKIGKSHLCFHCLRVTYVTRLARAGVPLSAAMRLVNHSSELVHRIYQRLGVEDIRSYANAVSIPSAAGATKQNPPKK